MGFLEDPVQRQQVADAMERTVTGFREAAEKMAAVMSRWPGAGVDDGGPVSGQGSMPPSTGAPEVRFTDEQRAALDSLGVPVPLDATQESALEEQFRAEVMRREAEVRAQLVSAVRDEIERCDDESIDFTATAEAVVEVFVKFLRTPLPIEGGSGGLTRQMFR
jgi:hypothetical protein